jgi:hypothetical protein
MPGAGVVITFVGSDGKRYVLTGKESVYLTDTVESVTLGGTVRMIKDDLQKSAPNLSEAQAKSVFQNRAQGISAALGQRVQFSQPVLKGTQWTTTYRILPPAYKYGIPKGRAEPGETPEQTARRELAEEVGVQVGAFIPLAVPGIEYTMFRLDIDGVTANAMLGTIAGRMSRHYGELFDVRFREPDAIIAQSNATSARTLQQLGGRRRSRSRRRTHRRVRRRATRRRI